MLAPLAPLAVQVLKLPLPKTALAVSESLAARPPMIRSIPSTCKMLPEVSVLPLDHVGAASHTQGTTER